MPEKYILINETHDETQVCLIVDKSIEEFFVEYHSRDQIKGNIYCGIVEHIQPSLQAAFVDFGDKRNGFLALNDVNYSTYTQINGDRGNTIQNRLKVGQKVLVQVTREAMENKGAALTTFFSFAGRYMVFMPNNEQGGGVSKRIEGVEQRNRLKDFLSSIQSEEHSVIIRTAGADRNILELKKDYTQLERQWRELKREFERNDTPRLLKEEQNVVVRTIRDYYTDDIDAIWTDNPETYRQALDFMKQNIPKRQKDLKLFVDNKTLFLHFGVEKQVEQLSSRKVNLKSGGYLIIDQTEALVAIDVNSGRSKQESNTNNTAVRTNIEAAEEIARQLRIRNLGGLIVVDFIDMDQQQDNNCVEQVISKAMTNDKASHTIGKISQFGLLELSRQRLSEDYARIVQTPCLACDGRGSFPSVISSSNSILRKIRDTAADGEIIGVKAVLPINVSNYLLNEKRENVFDLENEFGIFIHLEADPTKSVVSSNSLKFIPDEANPPLEETPKEKNSAKKSKSEAKTKNSEEDRDNATTRKEMPGGDKEADIITGEQKNRKRGSKSSSQRQQSPKEKKIIAKEPTEETRQLENASEVSERQETLNAAFLFNEDPALSEVEGKGYVDRFYGRVKGRKTEDTVLIPEEYLFDVAAPRESPVNQDISATTLKNETPSLPPTDNHEAPQSTTTPVNGSGIPSQTADTKESSQNPYSVVTQEVKTSTTPRNVASATNDRNQQKTPAAKTDISSYSDAVENNKTAAKTKKTTSAPRNTSKKVAESADNNSEDSQNVDDTSLNVDNLAKKSKQTNATTSTKQKPKKQVAKTKSIDTDMDGESEKSKPPVKTASRKTSSKTKTVESKSLKKTSTEDNKALKNAPTETMTVDKQANSKTTVATNTSSKTKSASPKSRKSSTKATPQKAKIVDSLPKNQTEDIPSTNTKRGGAKTKTTKTK